MKCATHNSEATALCLYCRRALCPSCGRTEGGQGTACSESCAAALNRADKAAELVTRKSMQLAKANALSCYLCGVLFVISGVGSLIAFPGRRFLPLFCGALGIALVICGVWYSRAAKQQGWENDAA